MHLSPREIDKLLLHNAGSLAQKRLARGLRLNHPESVALIATVLLEFIRDGKSVAELMNLGRQLLGRNQVMSGVPEMIYDVQVEGTFPDGSKLVTVHHPIASENGAFIRKVPLGREKVTSGANPAPPVGFRAPGVGVVKNCVWLRSFASRP